MDLQDRSSHVGQGHVQRPVTGRLAGIEGRLARPYWGLMGGWAAGCGALASNHLHWEGAVLLNLGLVVLLADLAWGSLWDLVTGTDWFRHLAEGWPPPQPTAMPGLPYTLPGSPGGRLLLRLNRLVAHWRQVFWPTVGPALLGLLAATALATILSLLLPDRLRLPSAALVALIGLGVVQRKQGKDPLAAQALVLVALSWLAGHLAFFDLRLASLALALTFALAAWGALRAAQERRGGLWLLNGGLLSSIALIAVWKQPLAAGLLGLLYFGAGAVQLTHRSGPKLQERTGPWLMAMMLVAAWTVP